ncbi:MAG: hypothetical protein ABR928_15965 [Terracidiphilus sp.]
MRALVIPTVRANAPVRGTQLLVVHMGAVIRRPGLTLIELCWRWLVGIPILAVLWQQAQLMLAEYPLESSGAGSVDFTNPWLAAQQVAGAWSYYIPHIMGVMRWLLPVWAVAWIVVSALGRNLLLMRIEPRLRFRPGTMIMLQAAWMAMFLMVAYGWFRSMEWVGASHMSGTNIGSGGEPDLVGFFIWAIFLSLAFFALWALVSWIVAVAPMIALLEERRSAFSTFGQVFRLGRPFTSKLAEINLVMGIVKIGLAVLAMVLSAAPLPFSDQLGPDAMHTVVEASLVFFLVATDYFQVVRIKAFVEFWKIFRGSESASQRVS